MSNMPRPAALFFIFLSLLFLSGTVLAVQISERRIERQDQLLRLGSLVSGLGLSDLTLTTDARYSRHPVASDLLVVSMDHPGGLDHFPSTFMMSPPVR